MLASQAKEYRQQVIEMYELAPKEINARLKTINKIRNMNKKYVTDQNNKID